MLRARTSRIVAAATMLLLVLLVTASPAGAAPAGGYTLDEFSFSCDPLTGDFGTVSFYVDRDSGDHVSLVYWEPGASPDQDPPTLVTTDAAFDFDGRTVAGTIVLIHAATEQPAGEATFRASLDGVGEPVVSRSIASGVGAVNDNVRILTTRQVAAVTGVLTLPDSSVVDLNGCAGSLVKRVIGYNNPAKFVEQPAPQLGASCVLPGVDGHSLRLEIFEFDGLVTTLALLAPGGEEEVAFGFGDVSLNRDRLAATVPLFDDDGEIGAATISATLRKVPPRRDRGTEGDVRFNVFVREQPLEGTVLVSGVGEFPLADCSLTYQRGWMQWPNPWP